ncbi:MAG: hypothetical protein Q9219_004114 [cf. Caloplaca sp. 3 TL-2023]
MASSQAQLPSAIFFNPQSKAADANYLDSLKNYLHGHKQLHQFIEAIRSLPNAWETLTKHNCHLASKRHGYSSASLLATWIDSTDSSNVAAGMSSSLTLPLLIVIQICQYFWYLEIQKVRHAELLQSVGSGGVHGYCGGLLPAVAVAISADEDQLVRSASNALRLALAIGIYADLGDEDPHDGPTNMVIRLKYPDQGEELLRDHPGVYISAVTDPKTISVVGPAHALQRLKAAADTLGLLSQAVHIRGKVHNPENEGLTTDLNRFCTANDEFRYPDEERLRVSLRSNIDGSQLEAQPLTHEVIHTILSTRCEWYQLLENVATGLEKSDRPLHYLVNFGIGDCLSPVPFQQRGLTIAKLEARKIVKNAAIDPKFTYEYASGSVAVVGMACRFPGANNVDGLWDVVSTGHSTVEELPQDIARMQQSWREPETRGGTGRNTFYANLIDPRGTFDSEFFAVKSREAVCMDPQQRLLLEVSYQALESSGYLHQHKRDDGDNVGVFIGASFIEYLANTSSHPPTAYNSVGTLRAFLCGRISHYFGWTGPGEVIDTACSSSLVAVNRACKAIQHGECSMALAGGVNTISSMENFLDLGKAGFLSPTGQCKPFDKDADGYCRAEGVGLLVLKPLDQALQNDDRILGVICGTATNQGGLSSSITVPHSPSQTTLYRKILRQASLAPEKVSYVEAHGTGTQVGDPLEIASIREVFGGPERNTLLHIGSIKGNIGHCETAAGIAGCIKALLQLQHSAIPPLASHRDLNPKIPDLITDNMAIASHLQPWDIPFRAICINSYGAAGSNAALLMCQPPSRPSAGLVKSDDPKEALPFLLSADSQISLKAYMQDLKAYLGKISSDCSAADVAFTLAMKRQPHRWRWATVTANTSELSQALGSPVQPPSESPHKARSNVLVFCGQVSRSVGVSHRLYESCELFRYHLDICNQYFKDLSSQSLFPFIFQAGPIFDIKTLHCCLFSYQYASALSWIESGLHVDAVVGQSFGELTALAVAGVLSLGDAMTLVLKRASLIESRWGSETGAMLAARCTVDTAKQVVLDTRETGEEIEIACYNAEDSYVLGGTACAIAATERILQGKVRYSSVKASRLDVTHAYHTKLTDGILNDLETLAGSLEFKKPTIFIETCTPERLETISPEHIRSHMRNPVHFQLAIRRLEDRLGDCVWLEAGSDSPTFTLVKRAVASPTRHSFHPLKISGNADPMRAVSEVTAELWRHGVQLSYWKFHSPHKRVPQQVWLPPYHFQETQHWLPYIDRTRDAVGGRPEEDAKSEDPQLIKRLDESDTYEINAMHPRFHDIVTGHAVLGRPLCPAGMYLECVLHAMRLSAGYQNCLGIDFRECSFESPLGTALDREIKLSLQQTTPGPGWSFEIFSSVKGHASAKSVLHAKGNVIQVDDVKFEQYQRLVSRQVKGLRASRDLDTLRKDKVYRLFSRIVEYTEIFQGISIIKFADTEAVADLTLKNDEWASGTYIAVLLDTFLQVCGLLVNSHDSCPSDHVYLAVGAKSITIDQTSKSVSGSPCTVYAVFEPSNDNKIVGDVFVLHPDGEIAAVMTGVQFTGVPLKTLGRMLDTSNDGSQNRLEKADSVVKGSQSFSSDTELPKPAAPKERKSRTTTVGTGTVVPPKLAELISQHSGCPLHTVTEKATIDSLGIDSLARIELKGDMEAVFDRSIDDKVLDPDKTIKDIVGYLGFEEDLESESGSTVNTPNSAQESKQPGLEVDPVSILRGIDDSFPTSAEKNGFCDFWTVVAPEFDKLVLSYIFEAFRRLGINLTLLCENEIVPTFTHLPLHTQLVKRLWSILEHFEIVRQDAGRYVRTSKSVPSLDFNTSPSTVAAQHPSYAVDLSLLEITGPKLADCLTGGADPLKLLFGNSRAQEILSDFYHHSPMLATMTDQLVLSVQHILSGASRETVRIIEVGAGFGGTTTLLAKMLQDSGRQVHYTFTDVAPALVQKARKTFSKYQWMQFEVLDLERDAPAVLQGKYDLAIATNAVHATTNLVASTRRLKSLLANEGILCLSEVTRVVDWYDLVFGLLPGWWCFDDGRSYALQSAVEWMEVFKKAGFVTTAYSNGASREANSQQLLIGSTKVGSGDVLSASLTNLAPSSGRFQVQTIVYKTVEDTEIHADVYFPQDSSVTAAMPIALMIHGGGFMTLSKSAVRAAQIRFLLAKGVLPVSLDYRLCPEINIIDGPMSDVRDAVAWARSELPTHALGHGIEVDTDKIAVLGWSTGGHLAMTTAWTTIDAGFRPPTAILSFYAPSDMEALGGLLFPVRQVERQTLMIPCAPTASNQDLGRSYPARTMSLTQIRKSLPSKPITSYDHGGAGDSTRLGWIKPGDPRSELVLSLFKEGNALNMLLNGLPDDPSGSETAVTPQQRQIDAINPIFHVRNGTYTVPTFLIHGTADEVVPCDMSVAFSEALKDRGVDSGVLVVDGAQHIHDLDCEPGSEMWDLGVGPGYDFLLKHLGVTS